MTIDVASRSTGRKDSTSTPVVRARSPLACPAMLAALVLLCLSSLAGAQRYQSDPVDENAGKLKLIAEACVRNPARFSTDRAQFVEFFDKYYFPAMTRSNPNDLGQLGRMREDLFGRFLWASSDENLQNELTQMALAKMWPIAPSSKYHPAVRYNAVLIIGMLDKTYAAAGRTPVPLKDSTLKLLLILNSAAAGKPVPPFLVVGALVGLQRHALYHDSLDRETVEAMSAAAQKLAAMDGSLAETDSKVAEWIRIQAATVLANLGGPGPKGEVLAVLAKMIAGQTTPKMSLDARCQVAALLNQIKITGASVDGKTMSDALLQLAVDVADDEAKEAKSFEDTQMLGGGYGGYGGAPRSKGRMKLDVETSMWEYDARILLARLTDLRVGLNNFKVSAPGDKQPIFDTVVSAIDPVLKTASSTDAIDLNIAKEVRLMAEQIRAAVQPGTEAPEEETPAELF